MENVSIPEASSEDHGNDNVYRRPKRETRQLECQIALFETEGFMRVDNGNGEAEDADVMESPYSSGLDNLRDTFLRNTRDLIFRTVEEVKTSDYEQLGVVFLNPDQNGVVVSTIFKPGVDLPVFTPKEKERRVERHFRKFFCFTKETALRPGSPGEAKVGRKRVFLDSNNYSQLDFFDEMDFKFSKLPEDRKNTVLPVKGDIVCILPVHGKNGRGPEAKFWFICSPQFLRTWTLIHYKEHDAIKAIATDESTLMKKVFSGNCTMTNGYLGWTLACNQNGVASEDSELQERFWNLRTEFVSREWVHVYSALVMMLRYKECPGPNNIPNKLDDGPRFLSWHIPADWLPRLFEKYELRLLTDLATRFIEVPVRGPDFVPKGTKLYTLPEQLPGVVSSQGSTPVASEESHIPSLEARNVAMAIGAWGDFVVEDEVK